MTDEEFISALEDLFHREALPAYYPRAVLESSEALSE